MTHDLVSCFRWVDGHADLWPLFYEQDLFSRIVAALADPFREARITKVAGIEARGFILGGAVAHELGTGFVAVRKTGGLFPGVRLERRTPPDYRNTESQLRIQRQSISVGDRVLLADDWCETGSQALTAKALIEEAGGEFVGTSIIVDQMAPDVRGLLGRLSALVTYDSLPGDPRSTPL